MGDSTIFFGWMTYELVWMLGVYMDFLAGVGKPFPIVVGTCISYSPCAWLAPVS